MTDRQFFDHNVCLVSAINATAYKTSGIAKDLVEIYPYANLFEDRKQLYNLNRTIWCDRPTVGSVIVKEPPIKSNYPYVVGLVTQFGLGDSVDYNAVAKYFVGNSKDMHYVNGLMSDTQENRRDYFKKCLSQLADYIMQNRNIKKVIFPTGIGRRGRMDHEWRTQYEPELKNFAHHLDLNDIEVVLLEQSVAVGDGNDVVTAHTSRL